MAKETAVPSATSTRSSADVAATPPFGMAHAAVIIAFVITAAVLALDGQQVQDILVLLCGAGAIGTAAVAGVVLPTRAGRRLARFMQAYRASSDER
ncbi:hypothetical protein BM536_038375 [Streptomyces phaeoluteigriseus]|uniref:Uncharacterized protein n=1 Tax=Streptomyces phaeoluteigriseus TaxID=114686 RepID=A0A1V6MH93_9ACTN|nr:hypothetical protein [Streptomyces phaeoluteigriseus]OQD51738.1 hypothetical protein BM536_038375 [Streptomyces phaeoluteigriseus]